MELRSQVARSLIGLTKVFRVALDKQGRPRGRLEVVLMPLKDPRRAGRCLNGHPAIFAVLQVLYLASQSERDQLATRTDTHDGLVVMEMRLDDGKFVLIPRHLANRTIIAHEDQESCGFLFEDILLVGLQSFGDDALIPEQLPEVPGAAPPPGARQRQLERSQVSIPPLQIPQAIERQ